MSAVLNESECVGGTVLQCTCELLVLGPPSHRFGGDYRHPEPVRKRC